MLALAVLTRLAHDTESHNTGVTSITLSDRLALLAKGTWIAIDALRDRGTLLTEVNNTRVASIALSDRGALLTLQSLARLTLYAESHDTWITRDTVSDRVTGYAFMG
ncbi:hypothetical protein CWB98_00925 [Pseudoalteromonas rubra]|uniref:Uncharacterized protein n=1 Tax=Pseudoalteromonas rubra TaxID=43658 RepID=A0A5S3X6V6_9GAMM|nr:hypothetical protein CWB98_00925 [Pseudoalteromonas rubra]